MDDLVANSRVNKKLFIRGAVSAWGPKQGCGIFIVKFSQVHDTKQYCH